MSGTIGALSVVRPDVTDMPERPALASQMNHVLSHRRGRCWILIKLIIQMRNVPDVFGMVGRRDSATESRVLQGRDARSI